MSRPALPPSLVVLFLLIASTWPVSAADDLDLRLRFGAVAAYDLPGKARWGNDDLLEYIENPFPLGAGAMAEVGVGPYSLSFTAFSSRILQQAVPSLELGGPVTGSFEAGQSMAMGPVDLDANGRVDLDATWALQGQGMRWRVGRVLGAWGGRRMGVEWHAHADVFAFDVAVDLDGSLIGTATVVARYEGLPLVVVPQADVSEMRGRVDVAARGVTLGLVPRVYFAGPSWLRLELGPRLELKTMGVEYGMTTEGEGLDASMPVGFGRTFRGSKIGYHVRLDMGPLWIEGNDDSGFADEWSVGISSRWTPR